jgi:transposase-like protein
VSILNKPYFTDEAAAYAKLESILWADGPVCPKCGVVGEAYRLHGKRARIGLLRCGACKADFTVKVGTVFESSHIPLHKWFQATYLMASSKKGFSAHQLHRTLEITYKSAWFMAHRLREAMRVLNPIQLGGEGMAVEADETFIGGKERNKHARKRNSKNIGGMGKEAVFSLVERGGRVRSMHMTTQVTARTLRPILKAQVDKASFLYTDEAGQYQHMVADFAGHEAVNHGIGEYVRGDAHSNTIEGYFSLLKRGITGCYFHVSQQHLKRYLCEFDFRYNERIALGVDDSERTVRMLRGIVGKRLTYRDSSAAA